eukprot:10718846-Lingulodinium_polyedra.AAC.1
MSFLNAAKVYAALKTTPCLAACSSRGRRARATSILRGMPARARPWHRTPTSTEIRHAVTLLGAIDAT